MIQAVFDYSDFCYHSEDPLLYLIKREINDLLRQTFLILNSLEQFILEKVIIEEKNVNDISQLLNINLEQVNNLISNSLLTVLFAFEERYYRKENI